MSNTRPELPEPEYPAVRLGMGMDRQRAYTELEIRAFGNAEYDAGRASGAAERAELVEALRWMEQNPGDGYGIQQKARAAIARATEGQP